MSLRKWWARRRAVAHHAYMRELWIARLRYDLTESGIGITDRLKVYCGWCGCSECGCDPARNHILKSTRGTLSKIHETYHTDCERAVTLIEQLEEHIR